MKTLLAFSDIHGNLDAAKLLLDNVKEKEYDVIIFAGDFASFRRVRELYGETMTWKMKHLIRPR